MKINFTFCISLFFVTSFLTFYHEDIRGQEKIVYNGVIDWEWSPRQSLSYGGNGFYWWHRPNESPGYVTNYGQMPSNDWKTPYDYENGTFYLRFQVINQPTSNSFTIQLGIWQDINSQKEVVSSYSQLSGGPGSSVQKSIGSPANWHQVFSSDVDFTRPENFYRIGFVLWKGAGSCIPMAQGWSNSSQCPNSETEALNFFPMRASVTVVAVASGRTFSGWANYPLPVATKPATPNYSIDFLNETTNKVIPSTDEYSYNSNMSGAVSGTGQKLTITPGQDVYFRTKAIGATPASDIQFLDVPVRPATPLFTYDPINQQTQTVISNAYEYASAYSMNGALTGNGNHVQFASGTTMNFRVKATATTFKSNIQALYGTFSEVSTDCAQYLSHYWKLEENNSNTLSDYGGSLDAYAGVSTSRVPGKIDYAQYFNGLSEVTVADDHSFDWNGTSSFSIEFWLNKSTTCPAQNNTNNNVVIGRDDASSQLHWWAGVSCLNPGKINFNLIANNGSGVNLVSKQGIIDGNWHHIAIVRNGTLGTTSIYIDGARDTTLSYTYTGDFNSTVPVNIGWLNLSTKYHLNAALDELAIYNRPITAAEISAHYNSGNAISYCNGAAPVPAIKIMPLGNSITFDNNIFDTRPVGDKIAYRYHLYNLLNHADYQFDFVGSESGGFNYFPDAENAGFPGIRAYQITQLLNSGYNSKDAVQETPGPYLDTYLPDIILLHIGTNSVQESAVDVENILNEIDAYKSRTGKNTKVIVARIINRQTYNATTTIYNNNLANVVNNRNDSNIFLIDMENGAGLDYATDMTDNLHPNTTGYQKMALNWFHKLKDILPNKSYKPFILVPPIDKGIVNSAYQSRVYAIGNPAPVFSLMGAPSGMTIHSQTGVINWLPGNMGNYTFSVLASNALGSDTVAVTLQITNEQKNIGNTTIYSSTSTALNRRAQPVTMTETGTISSISIYHGAGSGNAILAIYNTSGGKPNQRIAVTQPTAVTNSTGWQTFNLISPVTITQGETIWLAWVFQNGISIRYTSGTPGRAQSSLTYSGGMPELFGSSSISSSIYSIYASYTTSQQTLPNAPSSLTAMAVSPVEVNLAWTDNSTNETGFELERSLTSGSGFQLIATTSANINSAAEIGLIPNQTYYYRVRAFNNQGYSAYSPQVQVTMPGTGGTATVGYTEIFTSSSGALNRRAQPVTMPETGTISSITVYHSAGSGNAILAIYNTSGGKPNQRIAVTQPTAVTNSTGWQTFNLISPVTVSQGETIWLAWVFEKAVSMRYTSGTPGRAQSSLTYSSGMPELFGSSSISSSIYSIYASYTTSQQTLPNAPSSLTAMAVSSVEVNLAWMDNSTDETGFELERSLTSGTGFQLIATTNANINSAAEIGLIPNQTYYYRVRAFNNQGYSAYSPQVQVTMPGALLNAPSSLTAMAVSSVEVNLAWTDNSTDETGFEIERSLTSGTGFQLIATTNANINSAAEIGLIPNQTYYYRVRAFNNQGYSAYTPEVHVTMPGTGGTSTVGYTEIFTSASGALNRRAQPVTMPETGIISSITVYHSAGSGNAILAIYNTSGGKPNQRIAVTQPTAVTNSTGWQTFNLISPVTVSQGETIWLAWVFQNGISMRYASGTPGRAQSSLTYSSGMPELFGSSSTSASIYSIYANYTTTSVFKSLGNETFGLLNASEETTQFEFEVYPTYVEKGFNVKLILPDHSDVLISVYNIMGIKLADILSQSFDKGEHNLYIESLPIKSGKITEILYVRLTYKDGVEVRKILISH